MQNKVVSIIVPIYNSGAYLRECIDSILKQTYEHIEIILVNDGSTDDSEMICNSYVMNDNRIKMINKLNSGVSGARNAGLDIATGKYIAFVDSDDVIKDKSMYEQMCRRLNETDADLCICGLLKAYGSSVKISYLPDEKNEMSLTQLFDAFIDEPDEYHNALCFSVNKMYRRELLLPESSIDNKLYFDTELIINEDLRFNIDYFTKIKNGISFIGFAPYRINVTNNPNSLSKTGSIDYAFDTYNYLGDVIISILPTRTQDVKAIIGYLKTKVQFARYHYSKIYKRHISGRFTFSMLVTILRYSGTTTYKISAFLLYILPGFLYRAAFNIYK